MILGVDVKMGEEKTRVVITEFNKPILVFTKTEAISIAQAILGIAKQIKEA